MAFFPLPSSSHQSHHHKDVQQSREYRGTFSTVVTPGFLQEYFKHIPKAPLWYYLMIVQILERKQPAQFKNGSTFEDLECTNMEAAKIINSFLDHCNLVTLYLRTNPLVCSQVSADKRLATIFALLLAEIEN
jgi:hypothetical protein